MNSSRATASSPRGARVQRPLWASTSTKNPAYRDVLYVEELIGPDTVNTMPLTTIERFHEHGRVRLSIEDQLREARGQLATLADVGIHYDQVTRQLQEEGVHKFTDSFHTLFQCIDNKRKVLQQERGISSGQAGMTQVEQLAACVAKKEDGVKLVEMARRGGRNTVGIIVLGRGIERDRVVRWLKIAASVPGFIGFAVGRTSFWQPLVDFEAKRISEEEAATHIAHNFEAWIHIFEEHESSHKVKREEEQQTSDG